MKSMQKDTVLIVDNHDAIIEGVSAVLAQRNPNTSIYKALSTKKAGKILNAQKIDIAIIAIAFNDFNNTNGIALCKKIKCEFRDTKIICHTNFHTADNLKKLLQINVEAIVAKYDGIAALMLAIRNVKDEQRFYSQEVLRNISDVFSTSIKTKRKRKLSKRQKQIVELIAQAKTNKEISEKLSLAQKTIEAYITKTAKTIGLQRADKLKILYKLGLII